MSANDQVSASPGDVYVTHLPCDSSPRSPRTGVCPALSPSAPPPIRACVCLRLRVPPNIRLSVEFILRCRRAAGIRCQPPHLRVTAPVCYNRRAMPYTDSDAARVRDLRVDRGLVQPAPSSHLHRLSQSRGLRASVHSRRGCGMIVKKQTVRETGAGSSCQVSSLGATDHSARSRS